MFTFFANESIHPFFVIFALYFLLLSLSNIIWLRKSSLKPSMKHGNKVSVLIPARDEEFNIARCLESLLIQTYANYEILILDDQSTDETWNIISDYARRYPDLVKAKKGAPLPADGWTGKAHAMQQLSEVATGDYFLYTDADTTHNKNSVAWAVTNIERHCVDFLSGYVHHELNTFGERLIVPAMYIMTALILPLWLIPNMKSPGMSFAIGQFIMFKRDAFEAIGGFSNISTRISDDIFIVRELKKAGFRTIFLDIRKYVRCRMYEGYGASINGISKNIYDFLRYRPVFFAAALTVLILFTLLPLYLLGVHLLSGDALARSIKYGAMLFTLAWTLTLYDRGTKWWVPFLYPLLFIHLLYMSWRSFGKAIGGRGIAWKGRMIQ